ncbi:MAG: biopolymer transporter ExbD [Pseudomonadota bacterium]
MPMRRRPRRARGEPTIALINIVFLMLIFFLIAGTLAPPLDRDLTLVRTAALEGAAPPDALVVHSDGRLSHRGIDLASIEDYLAQSDLDPDGPIRLTPDRDLPAAQLVILARAVQAQTGSKVLIVTERALE